MATESEGGQVAVAAASAFREAAGAGRVLIGVQARVAAGFGAIRAAAKLSLPMPNVQGVALLERMAEALQNVAAGYELVQQAQQGVVLNGPTSPPGARTGSGRGAAGGAVDAGQKAGVRIPVGPEQRVAQLEKALEEARSTGTKAQVRDTEAALRKAQEQRDQQRNTQAADGAVEKAGRARLGRGPRERLEAIREELKAPDLSEARKGDLLDQEAQAQEAIQAGEKRRNPGSMEPGELVGELKGMFDDARSGNLTSLFGRGAKLYNTFRSNISPSSAPGGASTGAGAVAGVTGPTSGAAQAGKGVAAGVTQAAKGAAAGAAQAAKGAVAGAAQAANGVAALGAAAGAAGALAAALPALGLAIEVVGVVLRVGAAIIQAAFDALRQAIEETSARLLAFREGQLQSGGSQQEVSQLTAYGLDPSSIAGVAGRLRDSASLMNSDPYRMMGAGRLGVGPQLPMEMGGSTRGAQFVLGAIERLREIQQKEGDASALRVATQAQATELLRFTQISDETFERMRRFGELQEGMYSENNTQAASDLQENLRLFHANVSLLVGTLTTPVIQWTADALGTLVDMIQAVGSAAKFVADVKLPGGKATVGDTAQVAGQWAVGDAVARLAGPLGPLVRAITISSQAARILDPQEGKRRTERESAVERNTEELKRLNGHLVVMARGFTGGGERAERSLTLRDYALRRALEEKTLRSRAPVL